MTWEAEVEELRRREELARRMGGPDKVERQHASGKLTVRERIEALQPVFARSPVLYGQRSRKRQGSP